MDERGKAGERRRRHDHYLKGTVWCGRCFLEDHVARRMIMMRAVGSQKNDYCYFFCRGAQDHVCDAPYSNIDRVKAAIEEHYKSIQLRPEFVTVVRKSMEEALADVDAARRVLHAQLTKQLADLEKKENHLLGTVPQPKIRERLR